jgi:Helix-turn-helix domain
MTVPGQPPFFNQPGRGAQFDGAIPPNSPMLSPTNAWRILVRRTGFDIGRSTFYRWIQSGRIFSLKLGGKIYVPWAEIERTIEQCFNGDRS